jgi:hypothetical protein
MGEKKMDINKIRDDLLVHKNFFVIVADKDLGSYFHVNWDSKEFDLFKTLDFLKERLKKEMDSDDE